MHAIYNDGYPSSGDSEGSGVNEVFAKFWPSTIMDEPIQGKAIFPDGTAPDDFSKFTYFGDPNAPDPFLNKQNAVLSALWDLREHPRIGKVNTEEMFWQAMWHMPEYHEEPGRKWYTAPKYEDIPRKCIDVIPLLTEFVGKDPSTDPDIHAMRNYVISVFAKHIVPQGMETIFIEDITNETAINIPSHMAVNEKTNVSLTFVNRKNLAFQDPSSIKLTRYEPLTNLNRDNPDKQNVKMNASWQCESSYNLPASTVVEPNSSFSFNFDITAPAEPGMYAFDWAIEHDGQIGYVVSRDIMVGGFIRGDTNGDERLDIADAIFLLKRLFAVGPAPQVLDSADTNDDGHIDISDAVKILSVLFSSSPMPAPYPSPGLDPTPDGLN